MRYLERARSTSAGNINPELTRGARFHLMKVGGWSYVNNSDIVIAQEDVHGQEAFVRQGKLSRGVNRGKFKNYEIGDPITVVDTTESDSTKRHKSHFHDHPEIASLPPIE